MSDFTERARRYAFRLKTEIGNLEDDEIALLDEVASFLEKLQPTPDSDYVLADDIEWLKSHSEMMWQQAHSATRSIAEFQERDRASFKAEAERADRIIAALEAERGS